MISFSIRRRNTSFTLGNKMRQCIPVLSFSFSLLKTNKLSSLIFVGYDKMDLRFVKLKVAYFPSCF